MDLTDYMEGGPDRITTVQKTYHSDMVTVKNAYKRYNRPVLQGLNMSVPKGSIYAFLGPSGCGKTTLLNCIVGRKQLDSGTIQLKVRYKFQVGYMPQEIALIRELSIAETLFYYSRLFGISEDVLEKRKKTLFKFLEMPPEDNEIRNLSGGQQRRVSFCVSLIHNPELIILDEPTVGVDPLLCHRIWQYLLHLSENENKTIIITTHYIEEARKAHRVGMMRSGILLVEGEPNTIMNDFRCEKLEEVFLQLSHRQESGSDECINDSEPNITPKPTASGSTKLKGKQLFSLVHIQAHIIKNYYWLVRNKIILIFLLSLPLVQGILFGFTIGRDPYYLNMGVVNNELTQDGRTDCPYMGNLNCTPYLLSCQYMEKLKEKKMTLVIFDDKESAMDAAKKNHVWGVMHFAQNYSESLFERLEKNMKTNDQVLEASEVSIWMDMSNQYIGNLLKRDIYFAYVEYLERLYATCEWPVKASHIPILYEDAVYGSIYPSFFHFATPAFLQLIMFYSPVILTCGSILMEKREGLLERNFISGLTLLESLIGHSILALVIMLFQITATDLILFGGFGNPMVGNPFLLLALSFTVGVSGMCYGYLVSMICDRDITATYMGLGSFVPLSTLSGMFWPLEGMHYLLKSVSWLLPLTIATDSLRSISARGWDITHPAVYNGFLCTFFWILIFTFATWLVVRLKHIYSRYFV